MIGVKLNATPLQTIEFCVGITGVGLTVTVTVNVLLEHPPIVDGEVAVTV